MKGIVDESGRALLDVRISSELNGEYSNVVTWIDTAFDGHLVLSFARIREPGLDSLVETEAILADGSRVTLKTFVCFIDWFGECLPFQVIANDGRFPLPGTGLLDRRVLRIDYRKKRLSLD